jgi:hypothetical protein
VHYENQPALIWIRLRGRCLASKETANSTKERDYLVLTQPSEPSHATDRPVHTKAYERWMILPFVLGPLAILFALFYWASFYD